ncbi:MAG TPA: MFS transporter [Mycobacteriales bacterium]
MASSRRALGIVAFFMLLTTLASNAPSPLYALYQQRFHLSALGVTGVFAAYAGGVMVALFVIGGLSDAVGRRRVLAPALLLIGVSAVLFAVADGVGWLYAARGVQGLATGGITGAATAALVELEPSGDRQRASYLNTLMYVSGAAVGPLLFGFLAQFAPWPLHLPFLLELGLVAVALVAVRALPETVTPEARRPWRVQRPSVPRPILGPFVLAVLALSVAWGVGGLYAALSPTIDRQLLHVHSDAAAGAILFVFAAVGGITQIALRRWPSWRSISVGVLGVAVGMSLVFWGEAAQVVALFLLGTLLTGSASALAFLGSLALVNEVAPPARRAELVSAWNLVGYLSLSVPAIGVGLLSDAVGLQAATGIFTAVVAGLALVTASAVLLAPRRPLDRLSDDELAELGLNPAVAASGLG